MILFSTLNQPVVFLLFSYLGFVSGLIFFLIYNISKFLSTKRLLQANICEKEGEKSGKNLHKKLVKKMKFFHKKNHKNSNKKHSIFSFNNKKNLIEVKKDIPLINKQDYDFISEENIEEFIKEKYKKNRLIFSEKKQKKLQKKYEKNSKKFAKFLQKNNLKNTYNFDKKIEYNLPKKLNKKLIFLHKKIEKVDKQLRVILNEKNNINTYANNKFTNLLNQEKRQEKSIFFIKKILHIVGNFIYSILNILTFLLLIYFTLYVNFKLNYGEINIICLLSWLGMFYLAKILYNLLVNFFVNFYNKHIKGEK